MIKPKYKIITNDFAPEKGFHPFIDLGTKTLSDTLPLMHQLVQARSRGEINNILLLVKHLPVYTQGRGIQKSLRDQKTFIPSENIESLKSRLPYPLLEIERGGGITFHDKGQLVGYPIVRLDPKNGLGLHEFFEKLQNMLLDVLKTCIPNKNFERSKEATGIWVEGKKVVSIGIAVRRWVTFHGFAIHIDTDLSAFQRIRPCGLEAQKITNLSQIAERKITHKEILSTLLPEFSKRFLK